MAIELVREVYAVFKCTLQNDQLMDLTDVRSLLSCIGTALGFDESGNELLNVSSSFDGSNGVNPTVALEHDNASIEQSDDDYHAVLASKKVQDAFDSIKWTTDDFVVKGKLGGYLKEVIPRSTELCIAHIIDAFEQLGCPIRSAAPHQKLERVPYLPRHEKFMTLIYEMLEKDSRLIDIVDSEIIRTTVAPPLKSAKQLFEALINDEPAHEAEHRLTYLVGAKFANLITGKEDGLQLIFGTPESREITTDMYSKSPINTVWISQLESFLSQLIEKLPQDGQPICILEIGAGTGGTTSRIVPLLARLRVPVKYVMTDISSSLVAAARRRFKQYSFMDFKVVNMELEPDQKLLDSQHIIMATNCVHATRDLSITLKNLHQCLQPDGFLIMLEMTDQVPCFDFVFGFLEGWWLYEDGRDYALQPVTYWEEVLHTAGYSHVNWTEGNLPEANIQRLIIAHASGPKYAHKPSSHLRSVSQDTSAGNYQRQAVIEGFVQKYTTGFQPLISRTASSNIKGEPEPSTRRCVLVTGATGSLGAHIVASLVRYSNVHKVFCLNRLSSSEAISRQLESLEMRGISLSAAQLSKLDVIETDASKALLGLTLQNYRSIASELTDIVHSAWAMSLTRPIRTYEAQFRITRNLIDLAREVALVRPASFKFGFQFVSSAAVVANYPSWTGSPIVPEEPGTIESLPATGYAEAKLVVEQMLAATLYQYPDHFHAIITRIAQISGSTNNGYWNASEYMPFLIKSSQILKSLPDLDGDLSWYPVDCVAATLVELLMTDTAVDLVYHIDNPSRQSWKEMIRTLANVLNIVPENIVPYQQWAHRVRRFRASTSDNPASQLIEFFENYFVPMSCGGLIVDTQRTRKYSETLRSQKPVGEELVLKYVARWTESGFLNS